MCMTSTFMYQAILLDPNCGVGFTSYEDLGTHCTFSGIYLRFYSYSSRISMAVAPPQPLGSLLSSGAKFLLILITSSKFIS